LAPEIVTGRKDSGVLICEMLTGEPPFQAFGPTGAEKLGGIVRRNLRRAADYRWGAARDLIEQLLAKDPEGRMD
jgi:serine/threonine protein kinase